MSTRFWEWALKKLIFAIRTSGCLPTIEDSWSGCQTRTAWDMDHRAGDRKTSGTPHKRHKPLIVMCEIDWNTGLRRCPEKMSSLGGPTFEKKIYFLPYSCNFLQLFSSFLPETAGFFWHLECAAPKHWSKYTTIKVWK